MSKVKVGIAAKAIVMDAEIGDLYDGEVEFVDVDVNDISDMFLSKLQPKTQVELFGINGSIGSYIFIAKIPKLYMFARGDMSKVFKD